MNQIKAGAALNYVIIALNTLTGLLYTPYMLSCLGQNEYGLYSLVASVIAYLTLLDFGFGNAIIRYTAKFRAEGKKQEQWEMFGMFFIIYIVIGIIAFCGGLGLYYNVDAFFDKTMTMSDLMQAKIMMLLLTINLAFTFPLSIFGSIMSAYEDFVFQRVMTILRILLSTFVMIFVLSIGFKAIALVIVQTIFNLLTLLVNFIYCNKKLKIKIVYTTFDWAFIKEISVYSFWIFLNAIMDKIYWGTGQFVLGSLCGTIAVAVFSVAILLQHMFMTFSVSIVSVLLPRITSMVTKGSDDKQISDLFIKTGRIQCLIMSLVLCGFCAFGKNFIILWAGDNYILSYYIALIFFISLFFPLIQNVGITILQARNQMKFRSLLYFVISIMSLILQITWAKEYGAIGCAFAIGFALILGQGLIMNIYYKIKQRIDIITFWKEIFRMMIAPIIFTIIWIVLFYRFNINNIFYLAIEIITFSVIFVFILWKMCMNSTEKELILLSVKNLRK